jgi:hypothetical protein
MYDDTRISTDMMPLAGSSIPHEVLFEMSHCCHQVGYQGC